MYIQVKLHVDNKIFDVLHLESVISQKTDDSGLVAGLPMGGIYDIQIRDSGDILFFHWMVNTMLMKEVLIEYIDPHTKSKKIQLLDTVCVGYTSHFTNSTSSILSLRLSAAIVIEDGRTVFKKHWRVSDPDAVAVEPTSIEDDEPNIIDCYYTDLEGNENTEPKAGEEVYLVLETENYIGKTINIDLSNHSKDYIYNGEILENDILKDFQVTSNTHQIKLKLIKQQKELNQIIE